jgi:hypothetical protein
MSLQQRIRSERGAIATITAILAVALIGFAAFAIDLGNAFARKRIVQTQADLAALAGGGFLPDSTVAASNPAVLAAFDYLVKNTVVGDDPSISFTDFTDGDDANGEIRVLGGGNRLGVLAPPAFVDYGLAQVFDQDGLDVQAYAEVGVFSPGVIAPFFLPYGCSTPLPSEIFVKSGAQSTPTEPDPVFLMDMVSKNGDPSVDTVVPTEVAFGTAVNSRSVSDAEIEAGSQAVGSNTANFQDVGEEGDPGDVGAEVILEDAIFNESGGVARTVDDGVITSLDFTTLTSATAGFGVGDIGSKIVIAGAGDGGPRTTTIANVISPTEVTLAVAAVNPVTDAEVTITPGSSASLVGTITSAPFSFQAVLSTPADLDLDAGDLTITVASTLDVEITGDGFSDEGDGVDSMVVAFVRGTENYQVTVQGGAVEIEKYQNPKRDSIIVRVPEEVVSTSGSAWYIQVRPADGTLWSFVEDKQNAPILSVSSSATPGDQCGERVTGDFGLLDSPRLDTNQLQQRMDLNIARGIDHPVSVFTGTFPDINEKDNCRVSPQTPIFGGVLDDDTNLVNGVTPNCLRIENGNKVDVATDGMVTGGNQPFAYDGRLDAAATPECRTLRADVLGVDINDDVLSCFLTEGNIEGTVNGTYKAFQSSILDSPRFMLVPIIWASVNPQNGFYPIQRFVGAFITEQSPTTNGGSTASSNEPTNGVVEGTTKIEGISVIPFELDRLPAQADFSGDVIDYIGAGPKIVRLIK